MATLSDSQIAALARDAGFPDSAIPTAVAIARAESGGNPSAVSPTNSNGTKDYGLFQINSVHFGDLKINVAEAGVIPINATLALNPGANTGAAYALWKRRGGFGDWVTYNNGKYKQFLPKNLDIDGAKRPDQIDGPLSNFSPGDWVAGITSYVNRAGQVVGVSLLAALLIIIGLILLVASSRTVRGAAGVVSPVGRAVKAVSKGGK